VVQVIEPVILAIERLAAAGLTPSGVAHRGVHGGPVHVQPEQIDDELVFTGGIGEHSAPVRDAITSRLSHLGVVTDGGAPVPGTSVRPAPRCGPWW
jgi:hypothetical protein